MPNQLDFDLIILGGEQEAEKGCGGTAEGGHRYGGGCLGSIKELDVA